MTSVSAKSIEEIRDAIKKALRNTEDEVIFETGTTGASTIRIQIMGESYFRIDLSSKESNIDPPQLEVLGFTFNKLTGRFVKNSFNLNETVDTVAKSITILTRMDLPESPSVSSVGTNKNELMTKANKLKDLIESTARQLEQLRTEYTQLMSNLGETAPETAADDFKLRFKDLVGTVPSFLLANDGEIIIGKSKLQINSAIATHYEVTMEQAKLILESLASTSGHTDAEAYIYDLKKDFEKLQEEEKAEEAKSIEGETREELALRMYSQVPVILRDASVVGKGKLKDVVKKVAKYFKTDTVLSEWVISQLARQYSMASPEEYIKSCKLQLDKSSTQTKVATKPDGPWIVTPDTSDRILQFIDRKDYAHLPPHQRQIVKILLCGDGGVGKSTLAHRLVDRMFVKQVMTKGISFHSTMVKLDDQVFDIVLVDLGGQRHFRFFQDSLVMGTDAILFFFDLSRYVSFRNLDEWIDFLNGTALDWKSMPRILIGTKNELEKARAFNDEDVRDFTANHKLMGYARTSSITGQGVIEVFSATLAAVADQRQKK